MLRCRVFSAGVKWLSCMDCFVFIKKIRRLERGGHYSAVS